MLWRIYYAVKKNNYLKISTLLIVTCSLFAGILNFEGSNCINKINSLTNEIKINKTGQQEQQITPIQKGKKRILCTCTTLLPYYKFVCVFIIWDNNWNNNYCNLVY